MGLCTHSFAPTLGNNNYRGVPNLEMSLVRSETRRVPAPAATATTHSSGDWTTQPKMARSGVSMINSCRRKQRNEGLGGTNKPVPLQKGITVEWDLLAGEKV